MKYFLSLTAFLLFLFAVLTADSLKRLRIEQIIINQYIIEMTIPDDWTVYEQKDRKPQAVTTFLFLEPNSPDGTFALGVYKIKKNMEFIAWHQAMKKQLYYFSREFNNKNVMLSHETVSNKKIYKCVFKDTNVFKIFYYIVYPDYIYQIGWNDNVSIEESEGVRILKGMIQSFRIRKQNN